MATRQVPEGEGDGSEDHGDEPSMEDISARYEFLLHEMELYAERVRSTTVGDAVETMGNLNKQLIGRLRGDYESITGLSQKEGSDETLHARRNHQLRSCNIPFDEALWCLSKSSHSISGFRRRFPVHTVRGAKDEQSSPLVDIVAADGREWIKICTTSQRRMIFDLAKLGWAADSDGESEVELDSEDEGEIPVLKLAKGLSRAARSHRVNGRHPRVRVVFTKITEGSVPQFARIFRSMRALPCVDVEFVGPADPRVPPVGQALDRMVCDPFGGVTETVNLDCTTLLSLVSDLSHASVTERVWMQTQTKRQMENEVKEPILEKWLYPVLCGRKLLCTEMCRDQFWKIVNEIGTETERARAEVLLTAGNVEGQVLGNGFSSLSLNGDEKKDGDCQINQWRELSNHHLPPDFRLPVTTIPTTDTTEDGAISAQIPPKILTSLTRTLTPLNASIFLTGWATGYTTISSNIIAVNKIRDSLEDNLDPDEEIDGPKIWSKAPPRSLLAKEKQSTLGVECPEGMRMKGAQYESAEGVDWAEATDGEMKGGSSGARTEHNDKKPTTK